jgi:hypothetical protein
VGIPEFCPVAVAPGFLEGAQVLQARVAPELSGPLEAALPLPARRFHRAAADGSGAGEITVILKKAVG